jgi:2-aminoadipate transaminase
MLTSTSVHAGHATTARWVQTIKGAALRELFPLVKRADVTSFAFGLPAAELLPLKDCAAASSRVLSLDPRALQYQLPPESLKIHIQGLLASRGVNCRPDQIFLTAGAQQATHSLVNLFLEQRGQVIVEEVAYEGLQTALTPLQPEILAVASGMESGMDLDAVESHLVRGARPAFIYAITDGHNPLSLSLSQASRIRLVEMARRFRIPILEDDVFGFLNYDGPALPPMRALDEEWVFYIGSLSKTLAPALRIGWIVAPDAFRPALSFLKQSNDLDITTLSQLTVSAYLDTGVFPSHLATLRHEYGKRRDAMLNALKAHFPLEAQWRKPTCGMFIWVELPPEIDTIDLLRMAVKTEQVAFMPGAIFAMSGNRGARNGIRLNFTHCPVEQIEPGVARLARVLKRFMKPSH